MSRCDRCGAADVKLSIDNKCQYCTSYFASFPPDGSGPACVFCGDKFADIKQILEHRKAAHS